MNEASKRNCMKLIRFGKGKGLAHKTSQALAQRIVPAFYMCGLPSVFAHGVVFRGQMSKDLVVGLPKVTEGGTVAIGRRNPRPQPPTSFFRSSADEIGDNLSSAPTQGYPDPAFVFFDPTKDQSSSNSRTSSACAGSSGGKSGSWLSSWRNQLATVWRATPKVRSSPRKLDRS